MDYGALARQLGGSEAPAVDYGALAKELGGVPAALEQQPVYADIPYTSAPVVPTTRERPLSELSAREMIMGAIETPVALAATIAGAPLSILTSRATPEVKAAVRPFQYEPKSELAQRALAGLGEAATAAKLPPYSPAAGLLPGVEASTGATGFARAARAGRIAEERSAESYARAPTIEAAQEANRLGILLNPAASNPTLSNRLKVQLANNPQLNAQLSKQNELKWSDIGKRELGIDPREQLTGKTYEVARERIAAPYREVEKIGLLTPDDAVAARIRAVRPPNVIGGKAAASEVGGLVDEALGRVDAGMTSAEALRNIRQLRSEAQDIYRGDKLTPVERATADAKIGIANALEQLVDMNVNDPTLLDRFREARTLLAKSYAYEKATDLATGRVDPVAIAKMVAKDDAMTGDIASIGRIAANFPEVSSAKPSSFLQKAVPVVTRSGMGGTLGYVVGAATGLPPSLMAATGAAAGELGGRYMAKRIVTPEFQARSAVPPDFRIPMPPPPAAPPPPPTPNLPVPYDWRQAVQTPDEYYVPNFVFGRPTPDVRVQAPENKLLPPPSAASTMETIAQRRAYDLELERFKAQQAEQQAAAQAAATRQPTRGGTLYELDPTTGRLRSVSEGVKGATPETFADYGTNLASAIEKLTGRPYAQDITESKLIRSEKRVDKKTGKPLEYFRRRVVGMEEGRSAQAFNLTAEEKIAWDRARVDLEIVDSKLKKLSDAAVVEKAMDRDWATDAIRKAREKAAAFDAIAQRSRDRQAVMEAQANRERMLDLAEQLTEQMREARPVRKGSQGRKTMEFKRNQLAPKPENKLIEGE